LVDLAHAINKKNNESGLNSPQKYMTKKQTDKAENKSNGSSSVKRKPAKKK